MSTTTSATAQTPTSSDQAPAEQSPSPGESHVGLMLRDAMNTWEGRKAERKRKRSGNSTSIADVLDRAARSFVRIHHPFMNVVLCFKVGIACDVNSTTDPTRLLTDNDRQLMAMKTEERREYVNAFKAFLDVQHGLKQLFLTTENIDPVVLYTTIREMDTTARSARSDDTTGLKRDGLRYVAESLDATSPADVLSVLGLLNKSARGFHNVWTGRLLCPHRFSATYAEDPAGTCIQLQAGSLACTAENMPAFLYPSQQPYDSTDCLQKLLQGPLCVRVYKHIFLGRACALGQAGTTRRKNQAQLIGLERTTPRTIAYAAVQARHMLCSQADWCLVDGGFNNRRFFENIVALFEVEVDADPAAQLWVTETLDWWDRQVFEKGPRDQGASALQSTGDAAADDDDDFHRMMAHRKAGPSATNVQ